MLDSARRGALWCVHGEAPYTGPTEWTVTADVTWVVPATGLYEFDIYGGGGGGSGYYNGILGIGKTGGYGGGSSHELLQLWLCKDDTLTISIGLGGAGGSGSGTNGTDGGVTSATMDDTTVFNVAGGKGATCPTSGSVGSGSGSLGEDGSAYSSTTGGAGGTTDCAYGCGGKGADTSGNGSAGTDGAVLIQLIQTDFPEGITLTLPCDTVFIVPKTGTYLLDIRGGGGGGGCGNGYRGNTSTNWHAAGGGGGGQSKYVVELELTQDDHHQIVIGAGGSGGVWSNTNIHTAATKGGTTSFGDLCSIDGGSNGGNASASQNSASAGAGGSGAGSGASGTKGGTVKSSPYEAPGGSGGGSSGEFGSGGAGGSATSENANPGEDGMPGAVIVTVIG